MRSSDVIFGVMNDLPWFFTVYKRMISKLRETYKDLKYGKIIFIPNSLHCYERHFDLLKKITFEKPIVEDSRQMKLQFMEDK